MSDVCSVCHTAPATLVLRITPRRTDTPLTKEVKQALAWIGGRADVPCCGGPDCLDKVRRAGAVVHEWPTDPEATAVVREVD